MIYDRMAELICIESSDQTELKNVDLYLGDKVHKNLKINGGRFLFTINNKHELEKVSSLIWIVGYTFADQIADTELYGYSSFSLQITPDIFEVQSHRIKLCNIDNPLENLTAKNMYKIGQKRNDLPEGSFDLSKRRDRLFFRMDLENIKKQSQKYVEAEFSTIFSEPKIYNNVYHTNNFHNGRDVEYIENYTIGGRQK